MLNPDPESVSVPSSVEPSLTLVPNSPQPGKAKNKKAKPKHAKKDKKHCVDACKFKGKYTTEMLRCCGCNMWFHHSCVGEDSNQVGIWNCDICSNTGVTVQSLAQDVLSLRINIGTLIRSINILPEEFKGLHNKVDELNKELHFLQNTNIFGKIMRILN